MPPTKPFKLFIAAIILIPLACFVKTPTPNQSGLGDAKAFANSTISRASLADLGIGAPGELYLLQTLCGNGTCDPGENTDNCPSDCSTFIGGYCGDGDCEIGEESTCPEDCGIGCLEQTCTEGQFFDWESCTCVPSEKVCTTQTCPSGQTFDYDLCQCVSAAYCGNGTCDSGETANNCPKDCDLQTPLNYCGDNTCNDGENYNTCALDCPPPAHTSLCGDYYCDANSENYKTCPNDCPSPSSNCGDGLCDLASENPTSCPKDCITHICGNGVCDTAHGESSANCPTDCLCGDGRCDYGRLETRDNCLRDCYAECGNGFCQGYIGENNSICPSDCKTVCGDKVCETMSGEDASNCFVDCDPKCMRGLGSTDKLPLECIIAVCGDGLCEILSGETYANCQSDCRTVCGDYRCDFDAGETRPNCPNDCSQSCGNGSCERSTENIETCPSDCPVTAIKCGDDKCEPGEGIVCSECIGDGYCDRGENNKTDCSRGPGCSSPIVTGLPGSYPGQTMTLNDSGYDIPLSPLILAGIVVFMRKPQPKMIKP